MSFSTIRGQEAAIRLLSEAVASERVASGYLFFGPDGVGKRTTAHAFARAILCRGPGPEGACGECASCIRSAAGGHPGLIEVSRAEDRTRIRIEQIQELSSTLALRPMEGESSVAILDEVERTGIEAFNALLKTLEEPPPGATLILVTRNREALPETIRSRCQGVRFRPLSRDVVVEILGKAGSVPADLIPGLADCAGGSPGRAIRLLELGYPESAETVRRVLAAAAETDPATVGEALLAALPDKGPARDRVREILLLLIDEIRERCLSVDLPERDPKAAGAAIAPLATALARLDLNVSPETVLRAAVIEIHAILGSLKGPDSVASGMSVVQNPKI